MKLVSICIPTYEMNGFGNTFLKHSFNILKTQTFKDFDVIISDHSKTDTIKNLCLDYNNSLDIKYYANTENIGSSSANLNNAIKKATGKIIKILFQDDFLYSPSSLEKIVNNFNLNEDRWMVTACENFEEGSSYHVKFYPKYNDKIHHGKNTISAPSVLTINNSQPLLFDEKLIWLMDVDYYKRCYQTFGKPKIVNDILVVIRNGNHQVSNTIANENIRESEYEYILQKYGEKKPLSVKIQNSLHKYRKYITVI